MKKDDLISRSTLLADYDRVHVGAPGGARKLIAEATAIDAVPVVRCRDCIRRKTLRNGSHVCPYSTVDLELDDFCHRGKRKDDENGCK